MNIESQELIPNLSKLKSELLNDPAGPALYEDPHFLPKYSNLYNKSVNNDFQASDITWNRPGQLSRNPCLQSDTPGNIYCGHLTPPWFPTLLLILRERNMLEFVVPSPYFQNTFNQDPSIITPTSMNYCGAFQFTFRRGGIIEQVVIDDRLPCTINCQMLTSFSSMDNEFLAPLLEKAYAKYLGGYYNLANQVFITALMDFTGGLPEVISMRGDDKLTKTEMENVQQKIASLVGNSFILTRGYQGQYIENEERRDSFMSETHILLECIEVPPTPPKDSLFGTYIQPYNGNSSPNEISPRSSGSELIPAIKVQSLGDEIFSNGNVSGHKLHHRWNSVSKVISKWYGLSRSNNHEQWMSLEELPHFCQSLIFLHMFYRNSIAAMARNQLYWKYFMFESYWHRDGPRGNIEDLGNDFLNNDQYMFTVDKEDGCDIKVALVNIQKYVDQGANLITHYPGAKYRVTILEVERNRQYRVHEISNTRMQHYHVDCEMDRILVISAKFYKGTYVIVPWMTKGSGTRYTLQVFSSTLSSNCRKLELDIPEQKQCLACQISDTKAKLMPNNQRKSIAAPPPTLNGYRYKQDYMSKEDMNGTTTSAGNMKHPSSRNSVINLLSLCPDCRDLYPRRATRVSVYSATNLLTTKFTQMPRYFFRITCENESYVSRIVVMQHEPHWNEDFIFYRSNLDDFAITVEVFCEGRYNIKSSLGSYSFTELQLRQNQEISVDLEQPMLNNGEFIKTRSQIQVAFKNYFLSELYNA